MTLKSQQIIVLGTMIAALAIYIVIQFPVWTHAAFAFLGSVLRVE